MPLVRLRRAEQKVVREWVDEQAVRQSEVATVLLSSAASSIVDTREALTRILILEAMAVGGIALLLAYFSGRRITRPIQTLTATASAVREGELTAQAPIS